MHCCRSGSSSSSSCYLMHTPAKQLQRSGSPCTRRVFFPAHRVCNQFWGIGCTAAGTSPEGGQPLLPTALSVSQLQSPEASPLPPGKCWLAGVGPGGWDHVTVKVAKLISAADVLVYDDLGAQELLGAAPSWAEKLYVGKRGGTKSIKQAEINTLLVKLCKQGKRVVRLKGGCPSTFSRVSSEAAALAAAGCPYQLVPGVSTATAAAVLAGFPLTDTKLAGAYAVVSAHDPSSVGWTAFSQIPTLVILMGGRALEVIVHSLLATGWEEATPVAVIKAAGTADQQEWYSNLAAVVEATRPGVPLSPCIIVVGQVASLPAAWQQHAGAP